MESRNGPKELYTHLVVCVTWKVNPISQHIPTTWLLFFTLLLFCLKFCQLEIHLSFLTLCLKTFLLRACPLIFYHLHPPPPTPAKEPRLYTKLKEVPVRKSSREDPAHCGAKQIWDWIDWGGHKEQFNFNLISPAHVTQLPTKRNLPACDFPMEGRENMWVSNGSPSPAGCCQRENPLSSPTQNTEIHCSTGEWGAPRRTAPRALGGQ